MARPGKSIEAGQRSTAGDMGNRLAGPLGKLPLGRQVISLAIWPFLEQILSFLVNTVDLLLATNMVEGEVRIAVIDALGLGGYVMWLMMIVQGAVATGVLAITSRAAGAGQGKQARLALSQGVLAGLAMGTISGLLIRIFLPQLIGVFGLTEDASRFASQYLSIVVWICPVIGVLFAANSALRAIGDTRTPFFVMLLINAINIGLSWLFVFGPEGIGGMGIEGLAWGSLLAWLIGTAVVVMLLARGTRKGKNAVILRFTKTIWRPQREMIARICRVGVPQGIEMTGMWLIHSYTLRLITGLPISGALGAHILAIRVESLSFLPGFAIGTASAALIGQYLGAKNPEMAVRALKRAWLYAVIFMSLIGMIFLIAPESIVRLIIPETDSQAAHLINTAAPLVFLCGVFQPALATTMVLKTSLRAAGATRMVMGWSFTCLIFFRIICLTIIFKTGTLTLHKIWIVMSVDLFVQAIIFACLMKQGRWLEKKV